MESFSYFKVCSQFAFILYIFKQTPTVWENSDVRSTYSRKHVDNTACSVVLCTSWYLLKMALLCVFLASVQACLTNSDVIFLKLHAPWDVLCRYAELMNIRMPFRWEFRFYNVKKRAKQTYTTLHFQMSSETSLEFINVWISHIKYCNKVKRCD